jgi:uncharacterized protein with von Willebrand factor type A (vWA) domain
MLTKLLEFGTALRSAGLPVSLSETIDALNAVEEVPLRDRETLRMTLAGTLLKRQAHRPAFDLLFELYFGNASAEPPKADAPESAAALRDELAEEIMRGDGGGTAGLAERAVAALGRLDTSRDWYSNYEVTRALDLTGLRNRLLAEIESSGGNATDRALLADEVERRLAAFRSQLLAETRRRVAAHRGPEAVAAYAVPPLPEELSFLSATADLEELQRAVRPLARKLATRVAMKRRRARRGQLDIRKTVRHSLSSGGVPLKIDMKHKVPHRPELFVLCDVSSSVSRFSRFGLMLTHSLAAQFSKVRSFAFIDTVDEITRYFDHEDFAQAVAQMSTSADVIDQEDRSDYGLSIERFFERYGKDVGPKTTLLILGDARNNYRSPRLLALRSLHEQARHVYWLNPEARRDWDTGDSIASTYGDHVDKMVEVRNLRQLQDFIAKEL